MKSLLAIVALSTVITAFAHQATERYIPIGSSTAATEAGNVVSRTDGRLVVETPEGRKTFEIGEATRIWIDNSAARRTNETGSYDDCAVGAYIEVKMGTDEVAQWVKVRGS